MSEQDFQKLDADQKMSVIFGAVLSINTRLDEGADMFAGKWVEKGVVGAIIFVLVAVGGAFFALLGIHTSAGNGVN